MLMKIGSIFQLSNRLKHDRLQKLRFLPTCISTRPTISDGGRYNQCFVTSTDDVIPLRSKYYLPNEEGVWEVIFFFSYWIKTVFSRDHGTHEGHPRLKHFLSKFRNQKLIVES